MEARFGWGKKKHAEYGRLQKEVQINRVRVSYDKQHLGILFF